MELSRALGQALRTMRLKNGVSQEQTGASQSYVSDVERGLKTISIDKLDEFASSIGVHPVTILAKCYLLADETQSIESLISRVVLELNEAASLK